MTTFSLDGSDFQRVDWRLLQNGPVSLYFRHDALDSDVAWLRDHGYRVEVLECRAWANEHAMHEAFAAKLAFPDHYGMNLDAMNDAISDVDVPAESGLVIVLDRFDDFASHHRTVAQAVLDLLADNARRFLLFGRRLLVLVQSDDPRISFAPVGATAVSWNPKEWLDRDRGL